MKGTQSGIPQSAGAELTRGQPWRQESLRCAKRSAATESIVLPTVCAVDDEQDLHLFLKDLGSLGHFKLGVACYNGAEALERLPKDKPDAVIMDVRLPDISGIECASKLRAILPELPIIILTGYPDGTNFFKSLMAGARGFLVKPILAEELINALHEVLQGGYALAKQVVPFLIKLIRQVGQITKDNPITPREEDILACVFEGMQDKEIASSLRIGMATVHTHMHRLFEKLGAHSRKDIIAKFLALA